MLPGSGGSRPLNKINQTEIARPMGRSESSISDLVNREPGDTPGSCTFPPHHLAFPPLSRAPAHRLPATIRGAVSYPASGTQPPRTDGGRKPVSFPGSRRPDERSPSPGHRLAAFGGFSRALSSLRPMAMCQGREGPGQRDTRPGGVGCATAMGWIRGRGGLACPVDSILVVYAGGRGSFDLGDHRVSLTEAFALTWEETGWSTQKWTSVGVVTQPARGKRQRPVAGDGA